MSLQDILLCPITLQLLQDPVLAEDGYTYERAAITEWIRLNGTSPLTRQRLTIAGLRPNFTIRKVIDQFESNIQEKKFTFKLNVDVRREKRALFQTFGKIIYKAEWIDQRQPRPPIIILKIDGARANKEASFYVDLSRHPHIVRTYGLVEDIIPNVSSVMLLQEYASEGSLFELLSDQTDVPHVRILQEMFIQIADAMIFLAYNAVVHGDLACRNVLVFRFDPIEPKRNLVKLTDFGLSRFSTIYSSVMGSISTTTMHIVPIRTVAPEILIKNSAEAYSEKSDMFSMGMLMIEALNKGAMPWAHVTEDNEVQRLVIAGNRPPRPQSASCTDKIWQIISICLAHSPKERPTFKELHQKLIASESERSTHASARINGQRGYSNSNPASNTSSYANYEQQQNATLYPFLQYPIDFDDGFSSYLDDYLNSTLSNIPFGTNMDINMNNSNNFQYNNGLVNPQATKSNSARTSSSVNSSKEQTNGKETSEVRNVGSYHSIEASGALNIILTTDGPESVTLTSKQPQIFDTVTTVVEAGILKLRTNNQNNSIVSSPSSTIIINNSNINITNCSPNNISPTITVRISGAGHLTSLILSQHSNVESRNTLITERFQLITSGSSSFNGSFQVKQLNVNISGSSNVIFNGSSDSTMLSLSGSSLCHAKKLVTKTVQASASGSSTLSLEGAAEIMSLKVSGSSLCKAMKFEAKNVQVSASGASDATVYCTQTLEANIHGSSSVKYKGNAKVLKGSPTKID